MSRSYSPRRGRHPESMMRREAPSRCSLLVRGLGKGTRPDDLRYMADKYGPLKDVYVPKDYATGDIRGIAFVEFVDPRDADDAKHGLDHQILDGREISVVFALQGRKRPDDMARGRGGYGGGGGGGYGGGGGGYGGDRGGGGHSRHGGYGGGGGYGGSPRHSRRRSYSRSRSPVRRRRRSYSRSRSPVRRRSYSRSPSRSITPVRRRDRSLSRSPRRSPSRSPSRSPVRGRSPARSVSPARISPARSVSPARSRERSPGGEV